MIDQERLFELFDDFGLDGLEEIVGSFLLEAREAMDKLEQASGPDDVSHHLHFLKGCSRNVGASRIGDACEALENSGLAGVEPRHLMELRRELETFQAAVLEWTTDQAA